jgi:hypothetical protein
MQLLGLLDFTFQFIHLGHWYTLYAVTPVSQASAATVVNSLTPGMKSPTVIPADTHEVQSLFMPAALFTVPAVFPTAVTILEPTLSATTPTYPA